MQRVGFDNAAYIQRQSEEITKRISAFGGKLYLEFGGKLFDDFHASRVLPGFAPDSKIQMLRALSDKAELSLSSAQKILSIKRSVGIWESPMMPMCCG